MANPTKPRDQNQTSHMKVQDWARRKDVKELFVQKEYKSYEKMQSRQRRCMFAKHSMELYIPRLKEKL